MQFYLLLKYTPQTLNIEFLSLVLFYGNGRERDRQKRKKEKKNVIDRNCLFTRDYDYGSFQTNSTIFFFVCLWFVTPLSGILINLRAYITSILVRNYIYFFPRHSFVYRRDRNWKNSPPLELFPRVFLHCSATFKKLSFSI